MAFYSSGVEYGIHSLMCMVDAKGNEREMSVREMAALQGVPYDYLGKIFTRLSRAGLVISTEGDTDVQHYREVVWEGKLPAAQ